MKKTILFLVTLTFWSFLSAQEKEVPSTRLSSSNQRPCIFGDLNQDLNDTFTLNAAFTAQCSNCYDWDVPNGLQIVGSDQGNSVQITANQVGTYTVTLNYINEHGCNSCTKTIIVTENLCPTISVAALEVEYFELNLSGMATLTLPSQINPSTVASIEWGLLFGSNHEGIFLASNSSTYNSNPPDYNPTYVLNRCPINGDDLLITATISFNNSCPPQTLTRKYVFSGSEICDTKSDIKKVMISSNPTDIDKINVTVKDVKNKDVKLRIIDMLTGQVLLSKNLKTSSNDIHEQLQVSPTHSNKIVLLEVIENGITIDTKKIILK